MESLEVTLPGGCSTDQGWIRLAVLRPLSGQDEAFLSEASAGLSPAARTTALLARCLTRLGPLAPVSAAAVRGLTTGDREALLLQLRRLTFGERMSCLVACPRPDCGEQLDLELSVADLLVPPYSYA